MQSWEAQGCLHIRVYLNREAKSEISELRGGQIGNIVHEKSGEEIESSRLLIPSSGLSKSGFWILTGCGLRDAGRIVLRTCYSSDRLLHPFDTVPFGI